MHISTDTWKPEASGSLELEFQEIVSSLMWVLGTVLSPLQEQQAKLPLHVPPLPLVY